MNKSIITTKKALIYGVNELKRAKITSSRLDAEILLGFVLGLSQGELLVNYQLQITNCQLQKFKKLVKKRKKHVPIAYLVGSKEFYGIDFFVNKNVLVPRPETELIIDEVLSFIKTQSAKCKVQNYSMTSPFIIEIGTGSGCIALTLAKYLPNTKITACDISPKALAVARKNQKLLITNYQLQKPIKFVKSNLLSNIKTKPDILVANLPYLTKKELEEPSISQEPRLALYGGKDGLEIYRKLFKQVKDKGWENVVIFIEIDRNQAKKVKEMVLNLFLEAKIEVKKDLFGKDRVVIIKI